ncbi:ABC transporter ATP-binding protein [Brevibacillus porteri]|uniref:Bacitracin ABC transporter ATP-binding protein n=1 Tax=Brevibacillus porteri TaxID=2126350 RepID=A0ABX5FVG4_9BACL|nr:ABC transporter ATP-binding protein [Brevibacillus porteri]MED1798759.1 ABC transporter ATP-binding protein [Brevibacillus porteri]MED2131442.1 ABC transporter ATP-binding protein [Brevibacillus porteri]MED2743996.1 ABC transporter ATP-binding protein [Brevibacillus porteri]MED2813725.1 ABC transporter ATP-binding protein [Brevibacillus porteri]MED2896527.1 ABC transporter ATP-binding protein [Brevibacillus porteri]
MNTVIRTENLSKRYGVVYSVQRVNLAVGEGEVYGFLGPNGAGKSTTLKMLLGLVKPSEGSVSVFGKDFSRNRLEILSQTGSLIEAPSYYGHLTGLENMRVMQRLRDVPDKHVEKALQIVRLEKQKNKKVDQYSLGMKQRLGIAMALLHFPKLVILDEPTNGLDPAGIGEIRELIQSLPHEYGMTVLLSSHLLSEIEQVATSIGIIHGGKLLFQGSMEQLQRNSQPHVWMKTQDNEKARRVLQEMELSPSLQDGFLVMEGMGDREVAQTNRALIMAGIDVYRIEEHKKSLESIFLSLTGKEGSL